MIEDFNCEDDIYILNTGESGPIFNSTKELAALYENVIFPNPTKVLLSVDLAGEFNYEILNSQGQIIKVGNSENEIDVSILLSGIYFIQLRQQGTLYQAQKFIKL